ncbi:UDP-glucuronosyl/UDP-glucosyltransferase [Parasponia andersonii]|uniref:UDP-glucuronosyl/UDP-glucosyltransferase n=1 Tax=Parasponia andersonii TaxID=3476 RepID=A0A2P5CY55_PARAD|nr:UDP-glucuronosyl/UDP-glucosyltransferase [Parasponia andersonii]
MSTSGNNLQPTPHIALLPSAGMGHLTPFIRLVALLTSNNVKVTFITPHPTVSISESESFSQLFSTFPQITRKQLHLLPLEDSSSKSEDPFYYHFELIRRSSHLLSPLLASLSPPLSALVTDMSLTSTVIPITDALQIPNYIFFTSSAKMLSLFISFHTLVDPKAKDFVEISGIEPIPRSWIPPPLLEDTNNLMKIYFTQSGKKMKESSGILVNTYESIDGESLAALNKGLVLKGLPPVIAIGPLPPFKFEKSQPLAWLDDQPAKSVLYVSFGSRTAISREQIRELGDGLVRSGKRFLWVVKDKKVDQEDEVELVDLIGHGLMERVKERGMVVKNWLNQEEVLSHPAVGWFLSHCGWNSITEALWHGVPMLLWPQHGDQKINADLVERIGVGMWVKNWGLGGDPLVVVKGKEIAETTAKMTGNEFLRLRSAQVKDEARMAVGEGGSSYERLNDLIESWKSSAFVL